jgi:hypothetical protein
MKYLPGPMKVVKDNLFQPPPIFSLIQQNSGADDREMYQVFNMGHRMEIFAEETAAGKIIDLAAQFGVDAKYCPPTKRSLHFNFPKSPFILNINIVFKSLQLTLTHIIFSIPCRNPSSPYKMPIFIRARH